MAELLLHDANGVNLTSLNWGKCKAGKTITKQLRAVNNAEYDLVSVSAEFWPGMRLNSHQNTNNQPVVTSKVIRSDYTGTKKILHVDETEADGELTLRTNRDKVFLYNSGSATFSDYSSGNISCMALANDYLYIGFEVIARNFWAEVDTAGNYGTLTFQYSDDENDPTSFTACSGVVDGTSKFTVDGNIYFGALTQATWKRTTINGYCLYWIRIKAASVTTQAVLDVGYPNFIYTATKSCIYGRFTCYSKSADPTPVYSAATPTFSYENMGMVAYSSDPTSGGTETMWADFYYKIPQPGEYLLTFPTTATCSVNGGGAVSIVADGSTINTNVIAGIELVFSASLTDADTATIRISDLLNYLWYAEDSGGSPGTWQNYDFTIGDIDEEDYTAFHIKAELPLSMAALRAYNTRYVETYFNASRN
jgi:hypothetical protein